MTCIFEDWYKFPAVSNKQEPERNPSIRIRLKMSRIPNTACKGVQGSNPDPH